MHGARSLFTPFASAFSREKMCSSAEFEVIRAFHRPVWYSYIMACADAYFTYEGVLLYENERIKTCIFQSDRNNKEGHHGSGAQH